MIGQTAWSEPRRAPDGPSGWERPLREFVDGFDVDELAARYRNDDGLVVLPRLLPPPLVAEMAAEVRRLEPRARRTHVPFVRKGGAISHHAIVAGAPALHAVHQSPSLLALFQRIAGPTLEHRRPDDPHASALYLYDAKGDHVGWHKDDCGCDPEASFTVIVGLVDRSRSRLEFDLFHDEPDRRERRSIATSPGTVVFFCGSKAHHRVTPLGAGEERAAFSFVYVKQGYHPQGLNQLRQTAINTLLYFGIGHLLRRR